MVKERNSGSMVFPVAEPGGVPGGDALTAILRDGARRMRTEKTKGSGSRTACLTMVWKLMESASKHWRALNGSALLPEVLAGIPYTDGTRAAA